jgi:hypothetical protein
MIGGFDCSGCRIGARIAIKVLPDWLASDPTFRERFDREARTISQLDHPHICALYDVGEDPSTGSGQGVSFLVMQYLEGETRPAARGPGATASIKQQYAVARDGRFLVNNATEDSASSPITILQNWKPNRRPQ